MKENKLFQSLLPEYQKKLMTNYREIKLKKGESLFFEEDKAKAIYYVKKGHIKVYKTSIDGNETIFNIYPSNTFVALGTLFKDKGVYPASGKAVEPSIVYSIRIDELEEAIIADKKSSKMWLGHMNERLLKVQGMLSDQIFADGMERLKKLIAYFYENYPNRKEGKYIKIDIPITKQEMAELLNLRRETLSRMLSALKDENICECAYKEIIVNKDWLFEALQ